MASALERTQRAEQHRWNELRARYQRCVEIADAVWGDRLATAQLAQAAMAEAMRDRGLVSVVPIPPNEIVKGGPRSETLSESGSIPVPLFTDRDREQFLKEVAATLLIAADKAGLSVTLPYDEPVVPFGKERGVPLSEIPTDDLQDKLTWAQKKGGFDDFCEQAVVELAKRTSPQPLDQRPAALTTETGPY